MSASTRPCPSCRGETAVHTVNDASGEEPPVVITLHALPVLRCADGHVHFRGIEFPLELLKGLTAAEAGVLPVASRKGLLFKHYHCAQCAGELPREPDHREAFELDPGLPDTGALRARIEVPVYRCAGCGTLQLRALDDARDHTPGALAKAFEAAGIAREA